MSLSRGVITNPPVRGNPYAEPHARSSRINADYRLSRPRTLKGMLQRAQREYAMEPPTKMHTAALMDDHGDPAMTGQAQAYIGFHRPRRLAEDAPDEWREVACRRDEDGFYISPMRCAIESIRDSGRRSFLRDLLTSVFFVKDVAAQHGIPDWCATEVTYRSLEMLFDVYAPRPLPGPSKVGWVDKSDAQRAAEDAA